jgi:hypothetical protein
MTRDASGGSATNLEQALRDLADAMAAAGGPRGRDPRVQAIRQALIRGCVAALGIEPPGPPSIAALIRLAADAPDRTARRACAVLVVHALAVPGVVSVASAGDVCALAEGALRDVLPRCGYPFGGSIEEKLRVLDRLHATIGELMQPLQPTFPNWIQGLHAG